MSHDANKELMEAVLRQLDGKLDYKMLAHDLGLGNAKSAWQRWHRFKTRLMSRTPTSPVSRMGLNEATFTSPKTPKRSANEEAGGVSKKRKVMESDEEEDEDQINLRIKEEVGSDPHEGLLETPTRRMPARKARMIFKEEASEDEDFEEGGFEDSGHGSGCGGRDDTWRMSNEA